MRTVLAALVLALSACAPEDHDPTPAELEQLCVDTGECLVAECSEKVDAREMISAARPACVDDCSGTAECDACEAMPETQAWREDYENATLAVKWCKADCIAPIVLDDFEYDEDINIHCADGVEDATELCAVERALDFFDDELDHVQECADWISMAAAG